MPTRPIAMPAAMLARAGGERQRRADGQRGGERADRRVAGARQVEHLGRLAPEMLGALGRDQGHAILGAGDEHRAKSVRRAHPGRGLGDTRVVLERRAQRARQVAAGNDDDVGPMSVIELIHLIQPRLNAVEAVLG